MLNIVLHFGFIILLFAPTHGVRVLKREENLLAFDSIGYARVKNLNISLYSEFTMCIRAYFYQFPVETKYELKWFTLFSSEDHHMFFSLEAFDSGKKTSDLYYTIPKDIYQTKDLKTFVSVNTKFLMISRKNPYKIKEWNNVCVIGNKNDPLYSVVINGEKLFSINEFPDFEFAKGDLNIFGKQGLHDSGATYGKFSDFNFWDKALTMEEIYQWSENKILKHKPILPWNSVKLEIENLIDFDDKNETFKQITTANLFTFYKRNFYDSIQLCKSVGGEIASPKENIELDEFSAKVEADPFIESQSQTMWLVYNDEIETNRFLNIYTGK